MKMRFETSLAEEIQSLIEDHVAEQKRWLIEIIGGVLHVDLDDDIRRQLVLIFGNALEIEVYNPGTNPSDIGVRWTIDLEDVADWGVVSLDDLQEALAAEVEGIVPVLDGVAGFAEFQQKLAAEIVAAEIEGRSRRLEA